MTTGIQYKDLSEDLSEDEDECLIEEDTGGEAVWGDVGEEALRKMDTYGVTGTLLHVCHLLCIV